MDVFLGTIMAFGFNFNPRGWRLCNGDLLAISEFQALYSLLGTFYGGDGRVTFALPDLRGRVPMSYGYGPGLTGRIMGEKSGVEQVRLITTDMPEHNHTFSGSSSSAVIDIHMPCSEATPNSDTPVGNIIAKTDRNNRFVTPVSGTTYEEMYKATGSVTVSGDGAVGDTGGNGFHYNMQPCLAVNFCINIDGSYPPRT